MMKLLHTLGLWLGVITRYGKANVQHFQPDLKVGPYYIAHLSATVYAGVNDALEQLKKEGLTDEEHSNSVLKVRLAVVAHMLCDRYGYRLFDPEGEQTPVQLYELAQPLLAEIFIQCADRSGMPWMLPFDEYIRRNPEALERISEQAEAPHVIEEDTIANPS